MKKFFFTLCLHLILFPVLLTAVDYSRKENWVLCDDGKKGTSYDIFYIYPTLVADKNKPYMDWSEAKVAEKTKNFVYAQTKGIFGNKARIFAPYVRQLEYGRIISLLQKEDSSIPPAQPSVKKGMEDAKKAFLYYLRNYNCGRPFIFLGHSQGAMDLLYVLHSAEEISKEKGFVAAYLPGICVTETLFANLFKGKKIFPAKGEEDISCVILWNTMNKEGFNSIFAKKGALCINPLNWKRDNTPAVPQLNRGAVFYDYRTGKTERIPRFCGAFVDPEKGTLTVDLPSMSKYDANGFMGKGVFHMNDIWFFAENLKFNAEKRVNQWHKEKKGNFRK